MTDSMIERATAAAEEALFSLGACGHGKGMEGVGTIGVDGWVSPREIVRAVLAVMREPTRAMEKAGDAALNHTTDSDFVWLEMINAALAEEGR